MGKKKGVYADVVSRLKPGSFDTDDPSFDQVVAARKEQFLETQVHESHCERHDTKDWTVESSYCNCITRALGATDYAKIWRGCRDQEEELNIKFKNLNVDLEALKQILTTVFEAEGMQSLTLSDDGRTVSTNVEPYAVVKEKDVFQQWCIEEGLMKSLALPYATTNKIVKERLLAGESLPPGIEAFLKTKLSLRK